MTQSITTRMAMTQETILDFGRLVRMRAEFQMEDVEKGHHGDPEVARRAGLRGPVAYSLQYYARAAALLEEEFGTRWSESGTMQMAFLKPVCAGDEVTILITSSQNSADGTSAPEEPRIQIEVSNQLEELVASGTATLGPHLGIGA